LPGGEVEKLFCGLGLLMTELVHKGSIVCARPEHWDDVGIADLGEFMTLSGVMLVVYPQGFPLLLPATLQVPGIAEPHVCALEVAGKDLLKVLPTINWVSGQVIDPSFGRAD
jgi:hypothetical protein